MSLFRLSNLNEYLCTSKCKTWPRSASLNTSLKICFDSVCSNLQVLPSLGQNKQDLSLDMPSTEKQNENCTKICQELILECSYVKVIIQ